MYAPDMNDKLLKTYGLVLASGKCGASFQSLANRLSHDVCPLELQRLLFELQRTGMVLERPNEHSIESGIWIATAYTGSSIFPSRPARDVKADVLNQIIKAGRHGIMHRHLVRKTQFVSDKFERHKILSQLKDEGLIECQPVETETRMTGRWFAKSPPDPTSCRA